MYKELNKRITNEKTFKQYSLHVKHVNHIKIAKLLRTIELRKQNTNVSVNSVTHLSSSLCLSQ